LAPGIVVAENVVVLGLPFAFAGVLVIATTASADKVRAINFFKFSSNVLYYL
jgi:hypothetical protein